MQNRREQNTPLCHIISCESGFLLFGLTFSIVFSTKFLLGILQHFFLSHCSFICGSLSLFYYLWLSLTVLLSVGLSHCSFICGSLSLFYYLWLSYCSFICGGSLSLSFYMWVLFNLSLCLRLTLSLCLPPSLFPLLSASFLLSISVSFPFIFTFPSPLFHLHLPFTFVSHHRQEQ